MYDSILPQLETPSVLIDLNKTQQNIDSMQELCDRCNVALRPHIKTHKMNYFAKKQLERGAKGITCAKISEAEIMADGGCEDIFIAYPLVGDFRIQRALALQKKIKRLILAVDSMEGASALNTAAKAHGTRFEVRLEVDTGANRTGVRAQSRIQLATQIHQLSNLDLTGIYTFKSLAMYDGTTTTDNALAGAQEGRLLVQISDELKAHGINIKEISGGSSPTGKWVAESGAVTEIRPGTYIFKDCMLWKEGVAELEELSALVVATVVSTPCNEYAVIDGGSKVFPTDIPLNQAPYFYEGYAKVVGNDDLILTRVNEEHGMLQSKSKNTKLTVGQKILLYPGHICTTINLRNYVYLTNGTTVTKQIVDARGMSV